ncbi:hypothetical protein D9M71_344860 [compost metagenome]
MLANRAPSAAPSAALTYLPATEELDELHQKPTLWLCSADGVQRPHRVDGLLFETRIAAQFTPVWYRPGA